MIKICIIILALSALAGIGDGLDICLGDVKVSTPLLDNDDPDYIRPDYYINSVEICGLPGSRVAMSLKYAAAPPYEPTSSTWFMDLYVIRIPYTLPAEAKGDLCKDMIKSIWDLLYSDEFNGKSYRACSIANQNYSIHVNRSSHDYVGFKGKAARRIGGHEIGSYGEGYSIIDAYITEDNILVAGEYITVGKIRQRNWIEMIEANPV